MFRAQSLEELRASEHCHVLRQTVAYYAGPIDAARLDQMTAALSRRGVPPGMTWVLYGYGSSPRARYAALGATPGVEVLWSAPIVPWWAYPIALVAAAHGGLLRLTSAALLPAAMATFADRAMVEAYLVPETLVPEIVAYVRQRGWRSFIGQVAGEDPRYFCLGVDGDNGDTPSGYFGWASHGAQCPGPLVEALGSFTSGEAT